MVYSRVDKIDYEGLTRETGRVVTVTIAIAVAVAETETKTHASDYFNVGLFHFLPNRLAS